MSPAPCATPQVTEEASGLLISLNPDNVHFVIERLRELQASDAVEYQEATPDPGAARPVDDVVPEPGAGEDPLQDLEAELRAALEDLEPDQRDELLALFWFGRGDFESEDWSEVVAEARAWVDEPLEELLLATPLAGEYLAEGLDRHGFAAA